MANEPITQRISNDLRRQIQEGNLGPGALLPSETEVARDYDVSRQTARTALQALEREGLVIVRPRRGRVVRSNQRLRWHLTEFERPDHTVLTTSDAWETDIEKQGHDPTRQDLQVERITPPEAIATRLNLDPRTDTCLVRRHVRYIDGKPAIISDDYFDEQDRPGYRAGRARGHQAREHPGRSRLRAGLRHRRDHHPHAHAGGVRAPGDTGRNAGRGTHQDRLHRRRQASPRDDLDRAGRHADLAVHHPDLVSDLPQVRCALEGCDNFLYGFKGAPSARRA